MSSDVSQDKTLEEAIKLAELGQTTKLVEWARSYLHITRNYGISEFTVSRQTEKRASERGVVIIETLQGTTAVELFEGRPVRSGPLVWVEDQLKKLKAKVKHYVPLSWPTQDEKPRISNVWLFPNRMVVVLDQFGHQMPEYQGRVEDVREKINAVFSGVWR